MIVTIFTVLLGTSFTVMFAWTFIEPRFMFYAYDDLDWNSSMLGLVMNTYGIAMMLVEFSPSRMSNRLGRTPVILIGLVFFSAQFIGLAFSRNYILIATTFVIAGLGNALLDPALAPTFWISLHKASRAYPGDQEHGGIFGKHSRAHPGSFVR